MLILYTNQSINAISRITLDRPKWQGDDSLHLAFHSEYIYNNYCAAGDSIELSSAGGSNKNTTTPLDASMPFDTRVRRLIVKTINW